MAVIEINRNPTARELRSFGVGLLVFVGVLGSIAYLRTGRVQAPAYVWGVGAVLVSVYFLVAPLRRPIYLAWTYATFPIGWLVSHLVLAAVFYLVVTPIGVVMRLLGRDPLQRRFDRSAHTYWVPHDPGEDVTRYFRQF